MAGPFTKVVASSMHNRNIDSLSKSQSEANNYLNNEVNQFNTTRKALMSNGKWHNKISSGHNQSLVDIDNIHRLSNDLSLYVGQQNDKYLYENEWFYPFTSSTDVEVTRKWRDLDFSNLTDGNRALFHMAFVYFRDVVKMHALKDLYSVAFTVLDASESLSLCSAARDVLFVEDSMLRNKSPMDIDEDGSPYHHYTQADAMSLNLYNKKNIFPYIFEGDTNKICDFYNSVAFEYIPSNDFVFTPDSLIEIYHPALNSQEIVRSLNTHNGEEVDTSKGTPISFIEQALSNGSKGKNTIDNILSISKSIEKTNNNTNSPSQPQPSI